jgi:hypothetical protein
VGGVHLDAIREIRGRTSGSRLIPGVTEYAFYGGGKNEDSKILVTFSASNPYYSENLNMMASRVVPTANKVQPRAWGALACVYLGKPAS